MNTQTIVEDEIKTRHMPMYKVLIHNDDKTHFDFVVMTIMRVFKKSLAEAHAVTSEIHHTGVGLGGVYPLEHAELARDSVHSLARAQGFPLMASIEPVE